VDYADVFIEYQVAEELVIEDGSGQEALADDQPGRRRQGAGGACARVTPTRTILDIRHLEVAARQAQAIAEHPVEAGPVRGPLEPATPQSLPSRPRPVEADLSAKVKALLGQVDSTGAGPGSLACARSSARSLSLEQTVLIATSANWQLADVRPLTRLNVTVVVEDGGRREVGSFGGRRARGVRLLHRGQRWARFAREAARQALVKLGAVAAPAGTMTVVLGPGWPGILLHEAIGHGLEGDFNRKGVSAFSRRVGERVASDLVTVVDDGTHPNRRGSLNVDDEGTPTSRTVPHRERGAARATCRTVSTRVSSEPGLTGNGRRESFQHRRCRA
jgi:TldD protein